MRRALVFILLATLFSPLPTAAQNHTFAAGQSTMISAAEIALRSAPGYVGDELIALHDGDYVLILESEPVIADAMYWFKVSYLKKDLTGWIPDIAMRQTSEFLSPALPINEYGTAATARNVPRSCAGLPDYQVSYFGTLFNSTETNPIAADALTQLAMTGTVDGNSLAALTPKQYLALGAYYIEVSVRLRSLEPPAFALDWHLLQVDVLQQIGLVLNDASTMGFMEASTTHDEATSALVLESSAFFAGENDCADFLPWALTQSPLGQAGAMTA